MPALPRRQAQQATYHRDLPTGDVLGLQARLDEANSRAARQGTADRTVRHKLVQPHPHTGEPALRLDPCFLESVEGLSMEDGHRLVWELLRRVA
jgi:alpha-ketoglutarate-dependent taurine dioxygenase